jgi:hypothetical protein
MRLQVRGALKWLSCMTFPNGTQRPDLRDPSNLGQTNKNEQRLQPVAPVDERRGVRE